VQALSVEMVEAMDKVKRVHADGLGAVKDGHGALNQGIEVPGRTVDG
jgi:hypothetical protein